MPKFRKKPIVIEAEQYTAYGKLTKGMCNSQSCFLAGNDKPHVHTIHDNQIVLLEVGDWIVPEADGEHFYPIKSDTLATTYDRVPELCPACKTRTPQPTHPGFLCNTCIRNP